MLEQNKTNLTLTVTLTLNLLLSSIVFHNKICVFIITFMVLSFLWLFTAYFLYEEVMSVKVHVMYESQSKGKTVMSWSLQKKKEGISCTAHFIRRNFFNICVSSQYIVYWIHFQNIHTFTYQKSLLHAPFCLFLISPKTFSASLSQFLF